jgi:hypothetical protein
MPPNERKNAMASPIQVTPSLLAVIHLVNARRYLRESRKTFADECGACKLLADAFWGIINGLDDAELMAALFLVDLDGSRVMDALMSGVSVCG